MNKKVKNINRVLLLSISLIIFCLASTACVHKSGFEKGFEYYDIEKKEIYQLRLTIDNQKYIIKIFDYTLISIAPYDGNYEEDIIVMDNVPIRYNLYDYCYYIENNYKLNQ